MSPSPRTAPPGPNRSVLIVDRVRARLSPVEAARRVVADAIGRPIGHPRVLHSVAEVLKTMADGSPVVISARLPVSRRRLVMPEPTGYFRLNGHPATGREVVTLVTYNAKRDAVRFTPALGRGWGESGRAWLSVADLKQLFADGAKAWAPEKGPMP